MGHWKKARCESSTPASAESKVLSSVMAGMCYGGKGRLHFTADNAKTNADYYMTNLMPKLIEDCKDVAPRDFIFQQKRQCARSRRSSDAGMVGAKHPRFHHQRRMASKLA